MDGPMGHDNVSNWVVNNKTIVHDLAFMCLRPDTGQSMLYQKYFAIADGDPRHRHGGTHQKWGHDWVRMRDV